jgi:hypothetical protein
MSSRRQWEPPLAFAARFREHIVPRLELRLPDAALAVVLGHSSYANAWSELWWFAWFKAASFLSSDLLLDLEEWIHRRLLAEIDRVESEIEQESNEVFEHRDLVALFGVRKKGDVR